MSIEEELHENAEQARQPFDKRVAATMAVIAAALAVVSVLGHICTTEEIVLQQRAADQWAFSQAKNIRRYESEVAIDLLSHLPETSTEIRKYKDNLGRYERETEENQSRAREFEKERDIRHKEALRLHLGQVFLEISIVLASLAILTKRPMLWWLSIICTTLGLIVASSTALINSDATRGSPTRAQHDSNARSTATQTGCNMCPNDNQTISAIAVLREPPKYSDRVAMIEVERLLSIPLVIAAPALSVYKTLASVFKTSASCGWKTSLSGALLFCDVRLRRA